MKVITSAANTVFKEILSLLEAKHIKKQGRALCFGKKIVDDVIANHPRLVLEVIRTPKHSPLKIKVPENVFSETLFHRIDIFGTHTPALVIQTPAIPPFDESTVESRDLILLAPFQDPGNMGTCLRTAAAFGVTKIILTKDSTHPFLPKTIRAASGCHLGLRFYQTDDLDFEMIPVVGLDSAGTPISKFTAKRPFILAPGLEGKGLYKNLTYTHKLAIPMQPGIESLNASIATAIALYEISNTR